MTPSDPESDSAAEASPVLAPGHTYGTVTDKISALVLVRPYDWRWFLGLGVGFALTMMLLLAITVLLVHGVGVWGVDVPVMWGFAIVNFVWWIGIGHAGTLISAILLLLKQDWRTSCSPWPARGSFRSSIWAGPGFFTGCSLIPIPWPYGPSGAAR